MRSPRPVQVRGFRASQAAAVAVGMGGGRASQATSSGVVLAYFMYLSTFSLTIDSNGISISLGSGLPSIASFTTS